MFWEGRYQVHDHEENQQDSFLPASKGTQVSAQATRVRMQPTGWPYTLYAQDTV